MGEYVNFMALSQDSGGAVINQGLVIKRHINNICKQYKLTVRKLQLKSDSKYNNSVTFTVFLRIFAQKKANSIKIGILLQIHCRSYSDGIQFFAIPNKQRLISYNIFWSQHSTCPLGIHRPTNSYQIYSVAPSAGSSRMDNGPFYCANKCHFRTASLPFGCKKANCWTFFKDRMRVYWRINSDFLLQYGRGVVLNKVKCFTPRGSSRNDE